jgi:hypothetical protein
MGRRAPAPEGNGAVAAAAPAEPKKAKEPKEKKEQKPKEGKGDAAAAGGAPSTGPAKVATVEAPTDRELSSDDWASGKYGRPAGKLEVKPWSHTMYAMPEGYEPTRMPPPSRRGACVSEAGEVSVLVASAGVIDL